MAKKGGVQQLQADICTDEDFEKFLERPGLLVLDVYAEWCGPCVAMIGSLRKIKLEVGGDNLQLAICKSDTITALKRFIKKCEPTWLFVANGKAVNIMFGTDVPKLMSMITVELEKTLAKVERTCYEITEMQPIELAQLCIKQEALKAAQKIEHEERVRARLEYLRFVTDTIMQNMPDIGITLFGPQVNRDMFKKLAEAAEPLKMQCKDRKMLPVTREDFETINFACDNPLSPDVLKLLQNKELLICFWKVDESVGTATDVLLMYAHELTKSTPAVVTSDDESPEVENLPPLITPLEVNVQLEIDATTDEAETEAEDEDTDTTTPEQAPDMPAEAQIAAKPQEIKFKVVKIPPIWVPNNARTHAALIYVFFRSQTAQFLPPDPEPEPPHVVMTFDSYKKKDIINIIEKFKQDIPLYGFFTSDDAKCAQLIANSVEKYNGKVPTPTDKMILKVHTTNDEVIQTLLVYSPSYISPNTVVGRIEALKFFPDNYISDLLDPVELQATASGKKRKRKKAKRATDAGGDAKHEVSDAPGEVLGEETPKTTPEEGFTSTTSSGEESGESRHQSVERNAGDNANNTTTSGDAVAKDKEA